MAVPLLGMFAKTMAGIGSKAKSVGGSFFKTIHKTFVKGKSSIKQGIKFWKEFNKTKWRGMMNGIFQLIEAFGILDPLFRVFAALIKVFTAGFLIEMMPLFLRFVAVVTDPEYLAYMRAMGKFWADVLIPTLTAVVEVMEYAQPFFGEWAKMWTQWGDAASQLNINEWVNWYNMMVVLGTQIEKATGIGAGFNKWLEDLIDIITAPRRGGGDGGGGGGSGGPSIVDTIVRTMTGGGGHQEGTSFVAHTGYQKVHRGETIGSMTDNLAKATQMEDMLLMQEETLSVQKDLLHLAKYGV